MDKTATMSTDDRFVSQSHGNAAKAPPTVAVSSTWSADGLSQEDLMMKDECILLNEDDRILGCANKKEAHIFGLSSPRGILHRAFSVFLFDSDGRLPTMWWGSEMWWVFCWIPYSKSPVIALMLVNSQNTNNINFAANSTTSGAKLAQCHAAPVVNFF